MLCAQMSECEGLVARVRVRRGMDARSRVGWIPALYGHGAVPGSASEGVRGVKEVAYKLGRLDGHQCHRERRRLAQRRVCHRRVSSCVARSRSSRSGAIIARVCTGTWLCAELMRRLLRVQASSADSHAQKCYDAVSSRRARVAHSENPAAWWSRVVVA